ncbi:hypothetical protein FKM82_004777 [Ascaphus truei]|uniref:RNA guanine-N7 methyltransferase activating subunit n=1 Tax=Ascaphus truei TaxID=8439 RepID=UPI003F5A9EB7
MTETPDPVQMYEKMFAHRFTADDVDYQEYLKRTQDQPPIVEDCRIRPMGNQRNQDRYRDNRPQRGWEGRRDWSNSNSSNQSHRGRGWGNNYSQHRQERSYDQHGHHGYNPSNQRFQSDRYY